MSIYTEQEKDFIVRTKKIIDQYAKIPGSDKKYETTLLINCLLGLIIVPQQRLFKKLPINEISEKDWGIAPERISISINNKNPNDKSVNTVLRHIRNSLSHYNFIVTGNTDISGIHFEDYLDNAKTTKTFDAEFSIGEITKFIDKFYDFCKNEMNIIDS